MLAALYRGATNAAAYCYQWLYLNYQKKNHFRTVDMMLSLHFVSLFASAACVVAAAVGSGYLDFGWIAFVVADAVNLILNECLFWDLSLSYLIAMPIHSIDFLLFWNGKETVWNAKFKVLIGSITLYQMILDNEKWVRVGKCHLRDCYSWGCRPLSSSLDCHTRTLDYWWHLKWRYPLLL